MINFTNTFSKELDFISNKKFVSAPTYVKSKRILLICYNKILNMLKMKKSIIDNLKIKSGDISKLSLYTSLKQLDNINTPSEKKLNIIHKSNIIDNLLFLVPLNIMLKKTGSKRISNMLLDLNKKNNLQNRYAFFLAVYETFNRNKFPVVMKKRFRTFLNLYEQSKINFLRYV